MLEKILGKKKPADGGQEKPAKSEESVAKVTAEKEDIERRIERCLKEFFSSFGKEYLIVDFMNYDLNKDFNDIDIYDFEVIVEDEFFGGIDLIPDGHFSKIKDFVEFIKKNKQ